MSYFNKALRALFSPTLTPSLMKWGPRFLLLEVLGRASHRGVISLCFQEERGRSEHTSYICGFFKCL